MTLRNCIYISFQQITFKLGNFTNCKALFSVVSTGFSELVHVKSLKKNCEKGYFGLTLANFELALLPRPHRQLFGSERDESMANSYVRNVSH